MLDLGKEEGRKSNRKRKEAWKKRKKRYTDCPGEALVLGDVHDVERLHGVFNILGVHVVNLTDITVPEETHNSTNNSITNHA